MPKVIRKIPDGADKYISAKIKMGNAMTCLFSLVNALSIAAAAYSVVVFTLVVIYSKTALGMELDESFLNFFAATATLRETAFQSFSFSMIGFIFSLSLSRFLIETGIIRWIESIPTFIVSIIGMVHFKTIMNLASTLIYSCEANIFHRCQDTKQ